MRAILTLAITWGLCAGLPAHADDTLAEDNQYSLHQDDENINGEFAEGELRPPRRGPGRYPRRGPDRRYPRRGPNYPRNPGPDFPRHPGPDHYEDLCHGVFWGEYSNGVRAVMYLDRARWNNVNVRIQINNVNFFGSGTCDQYGYNADLNFEISGPDGSRDYSQANISTQGPQIVMNGRQGNGLYYTFRR